MRMCGLAMSVLMTAAAVAPAAPASAAKDDGLTLMVPTLAPMLPGQQGWISAMWQADLDVCDVQVTVAGTGGLKIGYPANTADYSSFFTNSALATGNMDYTAFNVAVPATTTAPVKLTLNVEYHQLPPGQIKKSDDLKTKKVDCKGPKGSMSVTATLPVAAATGAAVVQKTTTVTVAKATPVWTDIAFRGTRPNLNNFRVTLTPPPGLTVGYPGEDTSTGLDGNPALPVGQDDHVAVRLDAAALAPGSYKVPVTATYTGGSYTGELTLVVT